MFFSRKRKKIERVLVLDIGSGSVGVSTAVVFDNDSKVPALVESVFRSSINISGEFNFERFLGATLKALDNCLKGVHDSKVKRPDSALIVFASPWYSASPRTANLEKGSDFVFSHKELQSILKKEKESFVREISGNQSETVDNFEILDEIVHSVNLNGYPQSAPVGKTARNVSAKIFLTITEKVVFEKIKEKIKNSYPHIKIHASSFMNALFISLRDTKILEDDSVLVDIGGEMTEIVKVSHGTISSVASFPSGRRKLIREIMNVGLGENSLKMYEKGELNQNEMQKIDSVLKSEIEAWSREFKKILLQFDGGFFKAKKVCLTVDEDVIKIFYAPVLDVLNGIIPVNLPEIVVIREDKIESQIKFADKVPKDEFLMIETIFARRKIFE